MWYVTHLLDMHTRRQRRTRKGRCTFEDSGNTFITPVGLHTAIRRSYPILEAFTLIQVRIVSDIELNSLIKIIRNNKNNTPLACATFHPFNDPIKRLVKKTTF